MTTTTKPLIAISSVEMIDNETVMFIVDNEYTAKALIKKNPNAAVQKGDDDRYAVIYRVSDCNLMNAVKRK